jgi:hypothetical protein
VIPMGGRSSVWSYRDYPLTPSARRGIVAS